MTNRLPDEITIRRYLLGHLDADQELVERLDEQMLTDAELSEMVEVVTDEIIEEYLEGTLDPADKQAVETHFLRPPERQAKMRTARLLNRHLQTAARETASVPPRALPPAVSSAPYHRAHARAYMELAAVVLVAASVFYLVGSRQESQLQARNSSQALIQEREQSAALRQQLNDLQGLQQPETVMRSLFDPTLPRGDARLPELKIGPATKNVHFEISLPPGSNGAYDVRLETGGNTVWSKAHVQAYTSPDGALLILDVPTHSLSANEYGFVLSQQPDHGRETKYSFRVKTIK